MSAELSHFSAVSGAEERPLKILMVAPTSFFGHYGGHIRILEETRALQELGHDVTVVTYYKGQDVPDVRIVRTAPLPWRADYEVGSSRHKLVFDLYLAPKVLQTGLRLRPHIVHGHMHEGALIGGALARLLRVPLVFDFQGSLTGEMLDHGFIRPDGVAYRAWRRAERAICRLPHAILTSSHLAQRLLQTQFGVPPARIFPLPDCADIVHFAPGCTTEAEKAQLRRQLAIPPGRPVVAYLGLLAGYQGTEHLLQAAAYLKAAGEDVHFLIMGYPNEDRYREMARHLGVADRVTLTGRVDYYHDAPSFLSLGDIAVSPKMSATEGSGKVLNYMAMGQPVVAFDSPVHREYLAEWGVYVPPGDVDGLANAVASLVHDPRRRQLIGDRLRSRATAHYGWRAAGQRIASLYTNLLYQNSVRIA
ncbi:MAG: glycosyltransferase family 4 protein [Candidatus Promineifilaceae bacterium]|nr:glycosyltransferase family 4 protein [Candidatus Promineifilaceae bacterium]